MAAKATPQWFQQKQIYSLFKNPEFGFITGRCPLGPRPLPHSDTASQPHATSS